MFKNLLVLLIAVCFSAVVVAEADPHSGAHVGKKVHKHKFHLDKSKVQSVNKASIDRMHKLANKVVKGGNKKVLDFKPAERKDLKHEHTRNVDVAEIKMESLTTSTTKSLNKILLQSRMYDGESCDETSISAVSAMLANACLETEDVWTSDTTYASIATLLKVTNGGTAYGNLIQTYYYDTACSSTASDHTEVGETIMVDNCYAVGDGTSLKYTASNTLPSSTAGVQLTLMQGQRACNANDMNGVGMVTFLAEGSCVSSDDGTSSTFTCTDGSPYVNEFTDSSCTTYSVSYKMDDYNCMGSNYRYSCVSTA